MDVNCYFTCMWRVSNHQAVNVVVILLPFNPSTVSSSINALAAVTVEDIIRPHTNVSEKHLTWVSKGLSKCILSGFHWMICFCTLQTKNPTFDFIWLQVSYMQRCDFYGWTFLYHGRDDAGRVDLLIHMHHTWWMAQTGNTSKTTPFFIPICKTI